MVAIHKLKLLIQNAKNHAFVDHFLATESFPLVQDGVAAFIYRGHADAVRLRHWIFGLNSAQPLHRVPDTDLWFTTLEMPYGSRVEYKFEVIQHGHGHWIKDPLNPFEARDPYGANSVCNGLGYSRPDWTEPQPDVRQGTLEEYVLEQTPLGPQRVSVYLPARFHPDRRYNLLIVHDGGDYMAYASLKTVLDNLIHQLDVAPLIVAMTHPQDRMRQYPNDDRHAAFIAETLLDWMEQRYPTYGTPQSRCLMGASFGGVASLRTAWRYPQRFGRLLLQSGSFAYTDIGEQKRGPAFEPVVEFMNAFRANPGKPSERVFVSCGMYESLIYENRSLVPFFQKTGMEVRFVEARDGHNWENWRDRLREGLSWLFPGPQWFTYE